MSQDEALHPVVREQDLLDALSLLCWPREALAGDPTLRDKARASLDAWIANGLPVRVDGERFFDLVQALNWMRFHKTPADDIHQFHVGAKRRQADDYRATVAFPLYWRFRSGPETKQLMLNTYWREYEEDGANGWEFHFFPLFAFGKPRPEDHWWSVLYGLAGYRRSGSYGRAQILYIPFQTDGPSATAGSTGNRF